MPRFFILLLLIIWPALGFSATATIAVAANFKPTLERLTTAYQQQHPHQLKLASAATGVLYTQIRHGAPFDLLLAADSHHPQLLAQQGHGIDSSRFTYARGQLVLTGPALDSASPRQSIASLLQGNSGKLAIANPETAPYGLAARQTLQHLGLWTALQAQLVMAANIAQANQWLDSGNAALGLASWSQLIHTQKKYRKIPTGWHQPIEQQAILLGNGASNPAALDFIRFMQSPEAIDIIRQDGYTAAKRQ